MRYIYLAAAALACLAIPALDADPVQAQKASPMCMTRAATTIIVPPSRAGEMEALGYNQAECSGREQILGRYRQQICKFSQNLPPAAAEQFRAVYGVSAEKLCSMAQEVGE